jgi:hypothetical protein
MVVRCFVSKGELFLYKVWTKGNRQCVSCLEGRSVRSTERSEARKAAAAKPQRPNNLVLKI